ncbi:hypothetical protein BCR44DRAFT_1436800 [Catenaria anguillulae PL171]|uniref:Uncharacterized protein n=1 Tax=Catenaria anguillulae PL171 TaxID=765915 RepID=A0A1Y2HJR5_9FUNG|nr:hypothetical protein BCR44DRAFT_1436800 [Catenaria anguillulae PL171]
MFSAPLLHDRPGGMGCVVGIVGEMTTGSSPTTCACVRDASRQQMTATAAATDRINVFVECIMIFMMMGSVFEMIFFS